MASSASPAGPSPATPSPTHVAAIAVVAKALSDITLDSDMQDAIVDLWLQGTKDERLMIASLYRKYFHDPTFIQRVHLRAALKQEQAAQQLQNGNHLQRRSRQSDSGRNSPAAGAAATGVVATGNAKSAGVPKPLNNVSRRLRHAIDDAVPKLSRGGGPYAVRFGVADDVQLINLALQLYSGQFTYPEMSSLKQIVTVPKRTTTRTRRNPIGNFTWFLWCMATNEMACVVTTVVHSLDRLRFIEMPLFATASGYKRVGLGRLLNAALQEYCKDCGAEFILVSADQNAVDFWLTMGCVHLAKDLEKRIGFLYRSECSQFEGSVLLTWTPPRGPCPALVQTALAKAQQLCLEGPAKLPLP
jgi:hypothetical protein